MASLQTLVTGAGGFLGLHAAADFIGGGIANEGVAGADVEVNIGERLDAKVLVGSVRFDLGGQREKEAQFADFDRFFHDVDTVEVVDDDRFEDKIFTAMMSGDLLENISTCEIAPPDQEILSSSGFGLLVLRESEVDGTAA